MSTKSTRSTCITRPVRSVDRRPSGLRSVAVRRVAVVEDERVAVWIGEERHVTHARVVRLGKLEHDAGALQPLHRLGHVGDPERDAELGPVLAAALLLWRAQDDADVVGLELRPALARKWILLQTEPAVELRGLRAVSDVDA